MRGAFVTFEGGEGAGKTTQIKLLAAQLQAQGRDVVLTREPGGTQGAEAIRALILTPSSFNLSSVTETLLFFAARCDHVEKVIVPALKRGTVVLCDRFVDSTLAYQSALGEVEPRIIVKLAKLVLGDLKPDLTFILDVMPEEGIKRAALRRGEDIVDRFESESLEFHHRVRDQFLAIAQAEPTRCAVLDGNQDQGALGADVFDIFMKRLGVYSHLK